MPAAYANEVTSRVPNSRAEVIHDAAHLPMLEQPDEFARIVSDFLAE